jgi:DNA-binding transcriptional regulator YdaS (Cro superfamily)
LTIINSGAIILFMNLSTYLEKNSNAELAKKIGVSQGLVYQWATKRRPVSPAKCVAIEKATNGEVSRKELRDDWEQIWPELVDERRTKPYRRNDRRSNT